MKDKLKQQIKEREQEAKDKDIRWKAERVARSLGSHRSLKGPNQEGDEYTFKRQGLHIKDMFGIGGLNDGGMAFSGTTIEYQDQEVFNEGGGTLYSYIPGEWEAVLDSLQPEALTRREERFMLEKKKREEEEAKKDQDTSAKWGL